MTQLEAALEYADIGWQVLACRPKSKEPLYSRLEHGVKDATTDPEVIRSWFATQPDANLGVRCGAASGIIVLDVDPRHGGAESLERLLAAHGQLPDTVTCQTGGGGMHFYFAHPGVAVEAWKDSGLELRVENLYVLAPPSMHPSGAAYKWSVGPFEGIRPAPLPAFLLRPKRERPALRLHVSESPESKWANTALEAELGNLASCPAGNRNNLLNEAAFNLGQIVASGFLSRVVVENRLFDAASRNGSLEDDGEGKVRGTIRSGLEAGAKTPRFPKDYSPALAPAARTSVASPMEPAETSEVEYLDLSIEPPPVQWIIKDWLAARDIGVIAAGAGAGKSTVVSDLAVAISHGRPWCSSLEPLIHGPVLYFDEEQSRGTVQRLFRALGAENGRGLHVASCQGMVISTPAGRERLEREIDRVRPAMVVLDTIAQVFAGVDLSSLEEVSEVFRGLFRLRDRFETCFLMPTHNRKANRDARGPADPLEQMFGSIGFGGGPDTVWNARRVGNALEVAQSKRRDSEIGFATMRIEYARDEDGRISLTSAGPLEQADTELAKAEIAVVEILSARGRCSTSDIHEMATSRGIKKATVKRALEQLKQLGRTTSAKRGFWSLSEVENGPDFEPTDIFA